jgi:hypothetical protein
MKSNYLIIILGFIVLNLGVGCTTKNQPSLMNLSSSGTGPNEFLVVPSGYLKQPKNYSDLPLPTPGGRNRTDRNPRSEVIVALGGNENFSSYDPKLLDYVSRYGGDINIRKILAKEDLVFRKENDGLFLERMLNVNIYYKAYAKQSLDQFVELKRLNDLGVKTVSAPPEGTNK